MKTTSLVENSIRSLRRHRLRSVWIMLGSFVGVAALTFVLTAGQGARRKMLVTIGQIFGDSSVIVVAGGGELIGGPRPDAARLTIEDMETVLKAVPDVLDWDPQQVRNATVRRGNASTTVRVLGQSERSPRVWNRKASDGRFFDESDVKKRERVALIGKTASRELFGDANPVGTEILIDAVPFTVIGVLEEFGTDLHGMDRDNEIVVPISTLMRRLANVDTIILAKLLIRSDSPADRATAAIRQALRVRHSLIDGQPDDFTLHTPSEVRLLLSKVEKLVTIYLPLASLVVLVVGAFMASALMLGSVGNRIGEIGLRRAVGASPTDIARQFVLECTFTMLLGGIAGIAVGSAAAVVLAIHLKLGPIFSWTAVLAGLGLSLVTGLLAGVLPARRAAQLKPAEALR